MTTHRFVWGGEPIEVSLARDGERWRATIVRGAGPSRRERHLVLDARRLGDDHWLALEDPDGRGRVHDVRLEPEAGGAEGRIARFGGEHVALERIDPFAPAGPARGGARSGPRRVASPIPGRIVSVAVAAGDEVAEGQALVVVEAMKMANELRSPIAGRVVSVSAAAGDKVEAGVALVVVAPA